MREKTSVKDVIESCGVPHPEVDLILLDNAAGRFCIPCASLKPTSRFSASPIFRNAFRKRVYRENRFGASSLTVTSVSLCEFCVSSELM